MLSVLVGVFSKLAELRLKEQQSQDTTLVSILDCSITSEKN